MNIQFTHEKDPNPWRSFEELEVGSVYEILEHPGNFYLRCKLCMVHLGNARVFIDEYWQQQGSSMSFRRVAASVVITRPYKGD